MRNRCILLIVSLVISALSLNCSVQATLPAPASSAHAVIIFAIYYTDNHLPPSPDDLKKEIVAQATIASWPQVPDSDHADGLFTNILPSEKYAPPSVESLKYFGRGITNDDAQNLQTSKLCMVFAYKHDWSTNYQYLHAAEMIVHNLAVKTNGLLWDESARLLYTPASYKELVLDHWSDQIPSVRREVALHEYADGDHMRAVSIGMEKFGLPNLAINDFPRSAASSIGSLLVVCAQTMVEHRPLQIGADVPINLDQLAQKDVRDWILSTLLDGATKHDTLHLKSAKREAGDAETPLYEISFDQEKATALYERQDILVSRIFGKHDESMGVKHDAEMMSLVKKAQGELQALKPHFQKGLLPGERLLIESPFHQDNQEEWMWVEVTKWDGDVISGSLQNDPDIVKSLKAGAPVTVKASEAFDYLFVHSDGTTDGNETSKLIEKRGH